jgi:hypothetical protein
MIFSIQDKYGEKTDSSLVKIAQISGVNPIPGWRAYRLCDLNGIGGFTLSDMLAREAGWLSADLVHLVSLVQLTRPHTDERSASPCASWLSRCPAPAKAGDVWSLETAWRFSKSAWCRLLLAEGDGEEACQTLVFVWREDSAWSGRYRVGLNHVMNCGLSFSVNCPRPVL